MLTHQPSCPPQVFYVNEEDKLAVVRVIRIGSLQGTCSVSRGGKWHRGAYLGTACRFQQLTAVQVYDWWIMMELLMANKS